MKILDVWFYPRSKGGDVAVPVGRVVCREDAVAIEIQPPVTAFDPAALHAKLDYLVANADEPFEDLARLESDFWAFVPEGTGKR